MYDDEYVKERLRLPQLTVRTVAAKLRFKFEDVVEVMGLGVSREYIVENFAQQGLHVTPHQLSNFLSRERRATQARASKTPPPPPARSPVAGVQVAPPPASEASCQSEGSKPPNLEGLEAALDPKKRAEKADRYLNRNRSIIGRNAKGEN